MGGRRCWSLPKCHGTKFRNRKQSQDVHCRAEITDHGFVARTKSPRSKFIRYISNIERRDSEVHKASLVQIVEGDLDLIHMTAYAQFDFKSSVSGIQK